MLQGRLWLCQRHCARGIGWERFSDAAPIAVAMQSIKLGLPYGFGQISGNALAAHRFGVIILTERGEHNESNGSDGGIGLDGPGQFQAVHPGHHHVQYGQLIGVSHCSRIPEELQSILTVFSTPVAHAPGEDLMVQNVTVGRIVIDDENTYVLEISMVPKCRLQRKGDGS